MVAVLLLGWALQTAAPAPAQDVVIWPHGVSPLGPAHKENFGNHGLSISHREKSGEVEVHEATADVMVVESGEATLVYGGQVVDARRTGPDEVRGTSIRGGTPRHIETGDVVHFPAGMPHQWLLAPGTQITYLVVHIEQPQR